MVELLDPSPEVERLLLVLTLALAVGAGYLYAARYLPLETVVRAALAIDTLMLASMEAVLRNPNIPAVGYFWAIALSAFLCGWSDTVALTALGATCALAVPFIFGIDVDGVALAVNVLVLVVIGLLLAHMSGITRRGQESLARERARDEAALRLAERLRGALELDELLRVTVEEVGIACEVRRCILRLAPRDGGWLRPIEWHAPGVEPVDHAEPPPGIAAIFVTGQPYISDELGREITMHEPAAVLAVPVRWQDQVVAVLGLQDARPRDWRVDGLPLLERVGPQIGAALAQAELFEQQQAALERVQELMRLREELVANVSHELRTPLTATLGFLQTLERPDLKLDEDERRRLLHIARGEAERLATLVDDLLELARVERGSIRLHTEPVDLRPILEQAAARLRLPPGREVRIDVEPGVTAVGDPKRLLQVFSNLLENGLAHGRGTVRVAAETEGPDVELLFADDGPDVPQDRRRDLFVPFATWGERHDSTGLGLAIAQGLARAHGGSLTYRPSTNGQPHAFVVGLPAERPQTFPS